MRSPTPATRIPVPLVLALVVGAVPPAGAAGSVTLSATRNGSVVSVTGEAILPDGPLTPVVDDAVGDVQPPLGSQVAGDLTRVSLSSQTDGDLVVRWALVSLSGEPNGTLGLGRFRFRAGSGTYEVGAARNDYSGGSTDPGGWLLRCGPTSCAWSPVPGTDTGTLISRDVGVTLNFDVDYIEATVPVTALAGVLSPGSLIQPYTGTPSTEAAMATGQLELENDVDTGEMPGTYVYGLTVWLAAADPGADPAAVEYTVPAVIAGDGVGFSGALEASSGQAVFAKACLGGPSNCDYGRTEPV